MSKDSDPGDKQRTLPQPITAEEFDAMFDAGEDVSAYVDWDNGVMVAPGELSPGQKASLLAMFGELSAADKIMLTQAMLDAVADADLQLNVPLSAALHFELTRVALQSHRTREALVQSWIVERLQELKNAA